MLAFFPTFYDMSIAVNQTPKAFIYIFRDVQSIKPSLASFSILRVLVV